MNYRLTLDVEFDPQGTTPADLKANLFQVVKDAMNNGTLTGETPATVEHYAFSVKRIDGNTEIEQHDDRGDEQQRRNEKKRDILTLGDRVILRDILRTILMDDDLRRGFRGSCVLTTRDMNRLYKKLERGIDDEIGAIPGPMGG